MALTAGTLWEIRDTATTGNTGGSGFNPANANFLTDLAGTSATGNSPVVSSVSYTFVAGDVGAWIYVKSGTNWVAGFYQIASVSAGAATLSAAIGAAVRFNSATNMYVASLTAGCATTASPTGGTFGVDYSQQNTAQTTATDFAATGASTTLTSASAAFTPVMVGNIFHQTTTGTGAHGLVGWYEIVSYSNATTVVLDRTPNDGTGSAATTGFVGGAGRLNGLEDAYLEMVPAGSYIYIKNGTYTISGAISIASTNSTASLPSLLLGYNSVRGDTPTAAQRPVIAAGANAVTVGQYQFMYNLSWTTTASSGIGLSSVANSFYGVNCKFLNTSSTTTRNAVSTVNTGNAFINCEFISQNGVAYTGNSTSNSHKLIGCYFHDSATGASIGGIQHLITNCIFENHTTAALTCANVSASVILLGNTFYGREAKIGIGANFSGSNSAGSKLYNNIFYGFDTGVTGTTAAAGTNDSMYNDYFNNTSDATLFYKSSTDLALNPNFVGASQITGTTASGSGSILTDTNANFSTVTDNVDFVHVLSGTGATVGCYLITSHTTTTLTCNNTVGTNATADRVYFIGVGHNFAVGTNLASVGFPGVFEGGETTGYLDIGAAQRQPSTGGGSFVFVGG